MLTFEYKEEHLSYYDIGPKYNYKEISTLSEFLELWNTIKFNIVYIESKIPKTIILFDRFNDLRTDKSCVYLHLKNISTKIDCYICDGIGHEEIICIDISVIRMLEEANILLIDYDNNHVILNLSDHIPSTILDIIDNANSESDIQSTNYYVYKVIGTPTINFIGNCERNTGNYYEIIVGHYISSRNEKGKRTLTPVNIILYNRPCRYFNHDEDEGFEHEFEIESPIVDKVWYRKLENFNIAYTNSIEHTRYINLQFIKIKSAPTNIFYDVIENADDASQEYIEKFCINSIYDRLDYERALHG